MTILSGLHGSFPDPGSTQGGWLAKADRQGIGSTSSPEDEATGAQGFFKAVVMQFRSIRLFLTPELPHEAQPP